MDGLREPLGRWPDADADDWTATPDVNASQLTLYGNAVIVPDVTGTYVKDSVQDGASSFTRQGTVGGKSYHLYRYAGGTAPNTYVAWFLTTNTSGYPATTDPFFFIYQSSFGALSPAQGAVGTLSFEDPTAVIDGFSRIATVASTTSFTLTENRTARWTTAPDAWVHGFFAYPWADDRLPIASVAPSTGTITVTGQPYDNMLEAVTQGAERHPSTRTTCSKRSPNRASGTSTAPPVSSICGRRRTLRSTTSSRRCSRRRSSPSPERAT